ncbi:MAG: hypothetical protein HY922_05080 [Elusimicrobia bacterium]|nr:hypothetical protein [Elusimicrobiota bacterium]
MSEESPKSGGWLSFIIACVIYVIGYRLISGNMPGAAGALHWWSIIVLLLLWGAVEAAFAKFKRR